MIRHVHKPPIVFPHEMFGSRLQMPKEQERMMHYQVIKAIDKYPREN